MKLRQRRATAKKAEKEITESAPSSAKATGRKRKTTPQTNKTNSVAKKRKPTATKPSGRKTQHEEFIDAIADDTRRDHVRKLHELIRRAAPELEPTMEFGDKMLGYGKYHYKYKSGREGDWVRVGISLNKKNISLHCCGSVNGRYVVEAFNNRLGSKVNVGKSCVRFSSLDHLNMDVIEELIRATANSDIMQ